MTEYLEEDLEREDERLWEKHFEGCPPCNKFFESFKKSLELIEHIKGGNCPAEVRVRLEKLLLEKVALKEQSSQKNPES